MIDGSKRSTKANAFFTGFGQNKRIALYDTLVENHSVDELVGVMAPEIGHYKKAHIRRGMAVSILHFGVMFFLLSLVIDSTSLARAFGFGQPSVHAGLLEDGFSPPTVVEAVEADTILNTRQKQVLLELYRTLIESDGIEQETEENK